MICCGKCTKMLKLWLGWLEVVRVASKKNYGIPVYSSIFSSIFFKFKYCSKVKFQYIQVFFLVLVFGSVIPISHKIPDTFPPLPHFPLFYLGNLLGSVVPISNMKYWILYHPYHASHYQGNLQGVSHSHIKHEIPRHRSCCLPQKGTSKVGLA